MRLNLKQKAFTLIELLVVIAIIAMLLSVLLPSLRKAKEQARSVVCRSNLKQLTFGLKTYTTEYDDRIELDYEGGNYWFHKIAPYLGDQAYQYDPGQGLEGSMKVMYCPVCKPPEGTGRIAGTAKMAWREHGGASSNSMSEGTYGLNMWLVPDFYLPNRPFGGKWTDRLGYDAKNHYSKFTSASAMTPVINDSTWVGAWPGSSDGDYPDAPTWDVDLENGSLDGQISRYCIDRHNMSINISFVDNHVEKVPLVKLWSLSWYKDYPRISSSEIDLAGK